MPTSNPVPPEQQTGEASHAALKRRVECLVEALERADKYTTYKTIADALNADWQVVSRIISSDDKISQPQGARVLMKRYGEDGWRIPHTGEDLTSQTGPTRRRVDVLVNGSVPDGVDVSIDPDYLVLEPQDLPGLATCKQIA